MGITYNVTIKALSKSKVIKSKRYEPDYKCAFILLKYDIPKGTDEIQIVNDPDEDYTTNYKINFFNDEKVNNASVVYLNDKFISCKCDDASHLDYIITGTAINDEPKQNDLVSCIFDLGRFFAYPLFIYNAEDFTKVSETLHLNPLKYLKQTHLEKIYCDSLNIFCDSHHLSECPNEYRGVCPNEYADKRKDCYCDIYSCLYKCKFENSKTCIVRNFVDQIKKIK